MPMINFSRISSTSWFGKAVRAPIRLIPSNARVIILQGRLRGKRWVVGSSVAGCWLGSYEFEKQCLFGEVVRRGDVVFDIGAHVGFYTLLSSVLVGTQGQVFAFEPSPRNLYFLNKHLSFNRIRNVTVIDVAVSNVSGVTQFEEGPNSHVGHIADNGSLQVRTVSLDELVLSKQASAPNVMKIDVEGAEALVLEGAMGVLRQHHPLVFVATHSRKLHKQCIELLDSFGYVVSSTDERPLEQTDELLAV